MIILEIIAGTPVWVWPLLAFLLFRGLQATRPRRTGISASLVLPVIMLLISLSGSGSAASGTSDLVWIVSLVAGAGGGVVLANRMAIEVDPGPPATVLLPGSWTGFVLIVAIFLVNYVMGVMHAMDPGLAAAPTTTIVHALLRGTFSGVFLGRGLGVFLRAKTTERAAPVRGS
ncbi:hypothetical protein C8N35_11077 [Breoghania corrubedonensis]|uniref:Uncharacterized protein n=1 Tax=Breoghania corrubedonensis TaxID=665038 RepID=A0A2T5V1J3_9HYPH|nr:DUF6622 family protein [Breoghania corrubedonensis]PTW57598.1 hypothetical protein C8N35_11077 [Breoghania corrubedonensis]